MSLHVEVRGGGRRAVASAGAGEWAVLEVVDPLEVAVRAAEHTDSGVVLLLGGVDVSARRPVERAAGGLQVATGVLPDVPALRVLDVLLLTRRLGARRAWLASLGLRGPRAAVADEEAHVRALAGRAGLGAHLDEPAAGLDPATAAAVDAIRALSGRPRGLLWRRPEELPDGGAGLAEVVRAEAARLGAAVVEVRSPGTVPR